MGQYVLILGAGASKALHNDFGLGYELAEDINNRVTDWNSTDKYLSELLNELGYNPDLRRCFQNDFQKYRERVVLHSIDGFIDEVNIYPEHVHHRKEYIEIAKYLITSHILGYEGCLKNQQLIQHNWVEAIARFLLEKKILTGTRTANLKIITFNYDRSLEHLLYNSPLLVEYRENVKQFIQEDVIHVYGKIGSLEWQDPDDYFTIGEGNDKSEKVFEKKDSIQLIHDERWQDSKLQDRIQKWILSTDNVCIATYGYGFDQINNGRLSLQYIETTKERRFLVHMHAGYYTDRNVFSDKVRAIKHDVELVCADGNTFLDRCFS